MDEEEICKVCRGPSTEEDPLFHPCDCKGSIKFVHQQCLRDWLGHSRSTKCEVCSREYSFKPVYLAEAPEILSPADLSSGLLVVLFRKIAKAVRLLIAAFSWFFLVPFVTCQMWHLCFDGSFYHKRWWSGPVEPDLGTPLKSSAIAYYVIADVGWGSLLFASILVGFLSIMSLVEYIRTLKILNVVNQAIHERDIERRNQRQGQQLPAAPQILQPPQQPQQQQQQPHQGGEQDVLPQQQQENNDENEDEEIREPQTQERFEEAGIEQVEHLERILEIARELDQESDSIHSTEEEEEKEEADFDQNQLPEPRDELQAEQEPQQEQGNQDAGPEEPPQEVPEQAEEEEEVFIDDVLFDFIGNAENILNDENAAPMRGNDGGEPGQEEEQDADQEPQQQEGQLRDLLGLDGSLSTLFWHVISVICFNTLTLGLFVMLPVVFGKLAKKMGPSSITSAMEGQSEKDVGWLMLSLGYFVIVLIMGLCFFALYVQQSFRDLSRIEKQIVGVVVFLYVTWKVAFLTILELVIFPIYCGYLIHTLVLPLVSLHTLLSELHWSVIVLFGYWVFGFFFMFGFATLIRYLRAIVRPEVLWFLRNPDDPSFSPMRDMIKKRLVYHIKRFVLSAVLYFSLIMLLLNVPLLISTILFPSLVPFHSVLDVLYGAPFELLLLHVILPYSIKLVKPKQHFAYMLRSWTETVSSFLGLRFYLLGYQENQPPQQEQREPQEQEPPQRDQEQEEPVRMQQSYPLPSNFALRIVLLLTGAVITLNLLLISLTTLPIVVGRYLLAPFVSGADLYAYAVGLYCTWGTIALLAMVRRYLGPDLLRTIQDWTILGGKLFSIGFIWFLLLPFLLGLWFSLAFLSPTSSSMHPQTPSLFPLALQTYALGLLYLQIWYRLVIIGGIDPEWKDKFSKVRNDGIARMDFYFIIFRVLSPITNKVLIALVVPFLFNTLIAPLFMKGPLITVLTDLSYLLFSGLYVFYLTLKMVIQYLVELHHQIRDEKYLIGLQLQNVDQQQ